MKRYEIEIPFEKIEGKQSCEIQLISHRDKNESLVCWTVLENGRKLKLIAKLCRLVKKDCNGHEWHVSCLSASTHAFDNERWFDASNLFRLWLSVFTGVIREEKAKVVE